MYARLTFIDIDPKDAQEVAEVYNAEVAPVVKGFKGVSEVLLLEPTDSSGHFVSITIWKSKEDADEYENSGTYRTLVDKLKDKYINKPVLKTYYARESNVPVL
jgi:heme-degrading monooxygenase HmoA